MASLGIISAWGMIILCQLALFKLARQGTAVRPTFRMFGAPYTGYLTMAFLLAVVVLMAFDTPVGTWTVASIAIIVPLLVAGWYLSRGRIRAIAAERDGGTGPHPVIAHHALAGAAERVGEEETADV
jgi:L-asparagine permease